VTDQGVERSRSCEGDSEVALPELELSAWGPPDPLGFLDPAQPALLEISGSNVVIVDDEHEVKRSRFHFCEGGL
jgi:hypothetical protein